jgi:toxin ParE1/3/4
MYAEFHPKADREFTVHALFYERSEPGLGNRFIDEIECGIDILISQPQIGRLLDEELRRFVLDDFPFSLIYRIESERIWIVAVAHQSRRPGYWRERINR